jgi:phage shock protein PspC (stress-responsive transcriptional regulator)
MKSFLAKLNSRKFWACVAGFVSGMAIVFGLDPNTVTTISGAIVAVATVVTYISSEGRIDAAAVGKAAEAVQDAVDVLKEDNNESA